MDKKEILEKKEAVKTALILFKAEKVTLDKDGKQALSEIGFDEIFNTDFTIHCPTRGSNESN